MTNLDKIKTYLNEKVTRIILANNTWTSEEIKEVQQALAQLISLSQAHYEKTSEERQKLLIAAEEMKEKIKLIEIKKAQEYAALLKLQADSAQANVEKMIWVATEQKMISKGMGIK